MYDHFLILKHSFKTTWTLSEDVCVQNKNKKHKDHHNNNMSKFNFNPSLHMLLVYYAEWSQDGADFSLQSGRDTDQTENWEWKSESYTRPVQIQIYIYIIYIYIYTCTFFLSVSNYRLTACCLHSTKPNWQIKPNRQKLRLCPLFLNQNLTQDQSKYRNIYRYMHLFFLFLSISNYWLTACCLHSTKPNWQVNPKRQKLWLCLLFSYRQKLRLCLLF